jgi:hypothetical protein
LKDDQKRSWFAGFRCRLSLIDFFSEAQRLLSRWEVAGDSRGSTGGVWNHDVLHLRYSSDLYTYIYNLVYRSLTPYCPAMDLKMTRKALGPKA